MERDHDRHQRELQHLRFVAGGEPLGRLLHDYDGTPQHGGTRRDVSRDRPAGADLMAEEERQ